MSDDAGEQPQLTVASVASMAEAMGRPIDRERLPDVAAVLAELFALEVELAALDLTGVDPDRDDARWPERPR